MDLDDNLKDIFCYVYNYGSQRLFKFIYFIILILKVEREKMQKVM